MATTDAATLSASVEPTFGVRRKSRTNFQLAKQRFFRQKLAVLGLVLGVPLGLAIGRTVWREVAHYTPLQYVSPFAIWVMLLIAPGALLVANLLAAWPGRRAARLHIAHILRTE